MSSFSVIFAVVLGLAVLEIMAAIADGARAFVVFGDSLVDNGNNNYLITTARADSAPYGIDYPTHRPTGRFSNGYNIPDLISEALGAESTLAYLNPQLKGSKLLVGANFASSGIGILNDTGIQFNPQAIGVLRGVPAPSQLTNWTGTDRALVNKALVLVTIGGNDYVNNYFSTPITIRRLQYNLQDFSQLLISEYKKILQRLYALGARRVLVTGMGPLGSAEIATRSTNGRCVEEPQRASSIFNRLLLLMIKALNQDLGSDILVAVNAMGLQYDLINKPQDFGFVWAVVRMWMSSGISFLFEHKNWCKGKV